ncbi:MAG: molybdopterin-synthase adenylyltransferase MoeB [Leptospirales bacterium]|nr:molybdopterin-synthase adenylyltransferase MoeB [Leptospirales bacterium]
MSTDSSAGSLWRYDRQIILPEMGVDAQRRLQRSSALVVGAGGLGSPAAIYLAAAGIGRLGIVEDDTVEWHNLHRQILYTEARVGQPKALAARDHLQSLNSHIDVRIHAERLQSSNALEIISGYDIVLDGSDNFPTRYLVNDAARKAGVPDVYAAILGFHGQLSFFGAPGPCYRCLFAEPPPPDLTLSCAEAGVLGVLPGVMGVLQATEAIKYLCGIGQSMQGRLLLFDALGLSFREISVKRSESCPVCNISSAEIQLIDYAAFCGHDGAEQDSEKLLNEISTVELEQSLRSKMPPLLVDVRSKHEFDSETLNGARWASLDSLPAALQAEDDDRSIVVFCRSGQRSKDAQKILQQAGFRNVRSLRGGILQWMQRSEDATR